MVTSVLKYHLILIVIPSLFYFFIILFIEGIRKVCNRSNWKSFSEAYVPLCKMMMMKAFKNNTCVILPFQTKCLYDLSKS